MKRSTHNPARSAAQYGMAQAVLSGQSTALPKKVARELVDSTPARLRSKYARELAEIRKRRGNPDPETLLLLMAREAGKAYAEQAAPHAHLEKGFAAWVESYGGAMVDLDFDERAKLLLAFEEGINQITRANPASAAAELSEAWHGRPAKRETEHTEALHVHEYLTDLGGMELLEIARPKVNIRFGHDVRLASNEDGTQLYLVDGDQTIDLKLFKHADATKEVVVLGPVQAITYHTAKQHLAEEDKTPGGYRHEFGEEGGELPLLVYDTVNEKLSFAGGSYKIEKDMEGVYSAGLRD